MQVHEENSWELMLFTPLHLSSLLASLTKTGATDLAFKMKIYIKKKEKHVYCFRCKTIHIGQHIKISLGWG